jgi:diguanylate cyclase
LRIINTHQGRGAGDEVLRSVGQLLLSRCRANDTVFDCGGGKFVIVAPGMNRRGAGRVAHELCEEVMNLRIVAPGVKTGVTCTFGVADSIVAAGQSLLDRAEGALTKAKLNGRASVSVARPPR